MDYQSLVSIAPWTMIAQLCNLLLQAWLFKRFLFRPIQRIIAKRQEEINKTYDDAEQARQEAEQAKTSYESSLSTARDDAAQIVKDAQRSAQALSEQIVDEARQEAQRLREQTGADIELEKKRAMTELKNDVSGLAVELAGKIVEEEIDEKKHAKMIQQFIDSLGDAS